MFFFLNTGL